MRNRKSKKGFTLVELLVVIGIIALLISILLPSLNKARQAANTIKCLANLHSITQAMILYATENHDYILGSPNTTGVACVNNKLSPGVNQIWDWESPVLDTLKIAIPYSRKANQTRSNPQARYDRAIFELNYPLFQCPSNQIISSFYSDSGFASDVSPIQNVIPFMSYSTALDFLLVHGTGSGVTTTGKGNGVVNPPNGYSPQISKIGDPSQKIFISDGARYVGDDASPPDMTFNAQGINGGAYSELGAYNYYSNATNRSGAPGNSSKPVRDGRMIWARHGAMIPFGPADSFRFNAGFFDGHAETLGDLQGADPNMWAPKGTTIDLGECYHDVQQKYLQGVTTSFTVH